MLVRNARRGAVTAEFALVAPVLMLLLVAVVDLTNQMNIAFDVQQAARDGALVGANTTLGPDDDGSVITEAAEDQAYQVLEAAGHRCIDGVQADWYLDRSGYWMVHVEVDCPYEPLILKNTSGSVGSSFTMLAQQAGLVP